MTAINAVRQLGYENYLLYSNRDFRLLARKSTCSIESTEKNIGRLWRSEIFHAIIHSRIHISHVLSIFQIIENNVVAITLTLVNVKHCDKNTFKNL